MQTYLPDEPFLPADKLPATPPPNPPTIMKSTAPSKNHIFLPDNPSTSLLLLLPFPTALPPFSSSAGLQSPLSCQLTASRSDGLTTWGLVWSASTWYLSAGSIPG